MLLTRRIPFWFAQLCILQSTAALQSFDTWGRERIQLEDVSIFFRYSASGKPPLFLVHGFPEHSPTWTQIGPILAENYTVIAPDNRGCGESSLSNSDNYTAFAGGQDLYAIMNFLNISKAHVVAHDMGGKLAASLAFEHPERVERLVIAEFPLPGFGYSSSVTSPILYRDWQLAFFAVPDAAQFFIQGREKQMLAWYFYHGSYSGNDVLSNDLLETYTRSISKPGFLRAGMQYFATTFEDATYFQGKVNTTGKLKMPLLAMGGEASGGLPEVIEALYGPVASNLTAAVIPKAGHWIGEENPTYTANRILRFLADDHSLPNLDLSALETTITMFGNDGFGGGRLTPGING